MSLLNSIRWQDVVDVLLNSYVLFRFYVLFRGTNALRVLMGITALWFSQKIAVSLGLVVTSWVIQAVTTVAAIIIIVVFRNEIRSVLQTQNLKAILWGFQQRTIATPVPALVEAVFDLAAKRMGALVVVPGKEDLAELLHSGIAVNALLSRELLKSVFWPGNPVHDGAAVIVANRIAQVGAILPVSQRTGIPTYYGTRHRAALGLAERSDALVIAVSEERGTVSVARGERIFGIAGPAELERTVQRHLAKDLEAGRIPATLKRETVLAALACLLFITLVWFGFTRGEDTLITLEVPIEYINRNSQFEYLDTETHTVRLQLAGAQALLQAVQPGQIKARVDLNKAVIGPNTLTIDADAIDIPPGIMLRKVLPSTIEVALDVETTRKVPVQVDWTGVLTKAYTIRQVQVVPPTVTITGPSLAVDRIATVYTLPVPVGGIRESTTLKAEIEPLGESVMLAPGIKRAVRIDVTVEKQAAARDRSDAA